MNHNDKGCKGFSLPELVIAVSITGTLTAVATPIYVGQMKASCQRQAEATISQFLSQAQAFEDEYGSAPKSWADLDKIATIMTSNGPANSDDFATIRTPGCQYEFKGEANDYMLFMSGIPSGPEGSSAPPGMPVIKTSGWNVVSCINTANGSSDIKRGDGEIPAEKSHLTCS